MEGFKEKILYPDGIYRSCILDTINALQHNLYHQLLLEKGKASYDELYRNIKILPDTVMVQILGYEGTGKTVGASHLNPNETAYFNADQKALSFFGARQMYPIDNSKKNYLEVTSYEQALAKIKAVHAKRKGTFFVFMLGHIEDYKSTEGTQTRQRLKVLGKQASKMGIEGLNFTHTYYTKIDPSLASTDSARYKLSTLNSGMNTARSPQGYWTVPDIPNNYQLIVDRVLEDYGELEKISA